MSVILVKYRQNQRPVEIVSITCRMLSTSIHAFGHQIWPPLVGDIANSIVCRTRTRYVK